MTHDRDPLDELRASWGALEPPAPARPLADEDAPTRAAVGWMTAAWSALEAPEPASLPSTLTEQLTSRVAPRFPLAARLALALAAGLLAWFGFARSRPAHETAAPAETPVEFTAVAAPAAPIVLIANRERVELRSGSVRLVLLQPLAAHASGQPR